MRRFVCGDIHGAHRALQQVLARSNFDYDHDQLICLGDICDGWPETKGCVDELLKIKHLTVIQGNHDRWCVDWMNTGSPHDIWLYQGGIQTMESYNDPANNEISNIPTPHILFFNQMVPYHIMDQLCFVHGGFKLDQPFHEQHHDTFCWDRSLFKRALNEKKLKKKYSIFDEIYVGHTATHHFSMTPVHVGNIWNMDQGAGWTGKLSLMNIDTKTVWQSDLVPELYPHHPGRAG